MLNRLIGLGLLLGLLVGLGAAFTGSPVLHALAEGSAPLGKIFINAIKMVVIPLVVAIIFTSIASLGNLKDIGRIGGSALILYWVTVIPAIIIGMGVTALGMRFAPEMSAPPTEERAIPELQSIMDFIVSLIPSNPFAAAADGALLPLIVFTALLAAAAGTLEKDRRERLVTASEDISEALIKLVWWILYTAPIGVFGLVAPATAILGWDLVKSLGVFIACVAIGLLVFLALIYVPLIWLATHKSPLKFFRGIFGATTIAVSTTSTATAIPVTREEATGNLGVSEKVADMLIPLGASMYRPGSALFQGAAIVFLAYLFGVPLSLGAAGAVVLATFLVSLTVAPVPSSSVVTMAPALDTIGVPTSGLAIILGIDRIPDMMRSGVNLIGQVLVAALVDRGRKN